MPKEPRSEYQPLPVGMLASSGLVTLFLLLVFFAAGVTGTFLAAVFHNLSLARFLGGVLSGSLTSWTWILLTRQSSLSVASARNLTILLCLAMFTGVMAGIHFPLF